MTKAIAALISIVFPLLIPLASAARGVPSPGAGSDYITGAVTSAQSQAVSSVWVMVYDGTTLIARTLTGNDGRYYIAGLQDKTYTLVVRKQSTSSNLVSQTVSLPQNRVFNIRLPI